MIKLNKKQQKAFDEGKYQHGDWEWSSDISVVVDINFDDGELESTCIEYTGNEIEMVGMDYVFDNMDDEELDEFDKATKEYEKGLK